MSYESDMKDVISKAQEQNWRHRLTEKGHHQFLSPNGKDIVVASGTAFDGASWHDFMANMKRAGFRDGLGTLAEVMPKGLSGLRTGQLILDLLGRHPDGLSAPDIIAFVRSNRPTASANSVHQALATLIARGTLERPRLAFYRIPRPEPPKEPSSSPSSVLSVGAAPPQHAAGESSGDPQIDEDLAALDGALAALARIEDVVRRNRDVLHQLARLKKLLGGVGA